MANNGMNEAGDKMATNRGDASPKGRSKKAGPLHKVKAGSAIQGRRHSMRGCMGSMPRLDEPMRPPSTQHEPPPPISLAVKSMPKESTIADFLVIFWLVTRRECVLVKPLFPAVVPDNSVKTTAALADAAARTTAVVSMAILFLVAFMRSRGVRNRCFWSRFDP